jgi:hypothetical protein
MAEYFISGVWFSTSGTSKRITHVMLHEGKLPNITKGLKTPESEVIKLIEAFEKNIVTTIKWGYNSVTWIRGAIVGVETEKISKNLGIKRLRTHKDASVTDNLDNLINMELIG